MSGKTLTEIREMYKTTRPFSATTLTNVRVKYEWDRRRQEIINELHNEVKDEIKLSKRQQLQMVHMAIDMNMKIVEKEYVAFLHNPDQYLIDYKNKHKVLPAWIARDPKELFDLFKSHNFIVNDGAKVAIEMPAKANNMPLTPEEEATIWGIMRAAATRTVIPDASPRQLTSVIQIEAEETDDE